MAVGEAVVMVVVVMSAGWRIRGSGWEAGTGGAAESCCGGSSPWCVKRRTNAQCGSALAQCMYMVCSGERYRRWGGLAGRPVFW